MDYELLRKLYDIGSLTGYSDDEIREMSEGFDVIPATLIEFWKCLVGSEHNAQRD